MGDIDDYLYLAMGNPSPGNHSRVHLPVWKARDVYGMGMIIYEASFHHPESMPNLPSSRS